jgi:predicted CxxxxCH...CXXCH cytochrome family protein
VTHHLTHKWFFYLLAVLLLTACSGGGDSSVDLSAEGPIMGIAVDPYIEGAVFQEIDPGTDAVLQESSASNELGLFTFPQPLTPGSVVELKETAKGVHGGFPYQGMLRRLVTADAEDPMVISPLTTLLANGITPEELIAAFENAGLTGVTIPDLYADPMDGLAGMTTGVTDQDLELLQVSMAAEAYMEITGDNLAGLNELNDPAHFEIFSTMLDSMGNLLNPVEFEAIITALANDPDITTPLILEDFILAVLEEQRTIVALAQENMANNNDTFDPAMVTQAEQAAMQNGAANVKSYYSLRVPPSTTYDGAALYHDNCSGCHQPLDVTTKTGRSAADIQTAIDNNVGSMGSLSNLTQGEVAAISEVLPAAPVVDPPASVDGAALYGSYCSNCHGTPLANTTKPGRTAADIQNAIDNNDGGMGSLSLTPEEVLAIADVLPAPPVVDPGTPPDGAALYGSSCAGCHNPLDTTSKPGRSAAQIQAAIDGNIGNMGSLSSLTPEEVLAIADVLPASPGVDPGPDYSDCTLCHGQPPSGDVFPDTAGAHAVHAALASVGTDCSICHLGAAHNTGVDLAFPAGFDAKSGPATDNLDGTCSSVKCHGGKTTPDWWSGSIAVDTQCTACHASGSSQYNSYSSGEHNRHVSRFDCTVCHNTATLQSGHFTNLESTAFELNPAATIGGGTTRVGSYNNGTCSSVQCHGNENW